MKLLAQVLLCLAAAAAVPVAAQTSVAPRDLQRSTDASALAQFYTALARGFRPLDRPWDPKGGAQLTDQIPNWDRAAEKRCCSGLTRVEWFQMACDTDSPRGGRTNRC